MGPMLLHGKKTTAVLPKLVEAYDGVEKQFEGIPFFDGSPINPIEESFLVLDSASEGIERIWEEDFQEEEVVTWLLSSADESYEKSLCEDSSGLESSCTSPSTNHDSSLQMWGFDRMSVWAMLLDLNEEDSMWVSDKESELDVSDFPSPSYKMKWGSEAQSSGSSVSFTEEKLEDVLYDLSPRHVSEAAHLDVSNTDEPLFWPYKRKFEIIWDLFCMSPRKNGEDGGIPKGLCTPNSVRLRLHDRKRIVFSSISSNKGIGKISTKPSRLSKSTHVQMETIVLEKKLNVEQPTNCKVPTETIVGDYREFFEKCFSSKEEVAIETLLGLDEFDGHEGVDAGFNENKFSLDDSL